MKLHEAAGMVVREMGKLVAAEMARIDCMPWSDHEKRRQQCLTFEVAMQQLRDRGIVTAEHMMALNRNSQLDFSKAYPVPNKPVYEPQPQMKAGCRNEGL